MAWVEGEATDSRYRSTRESERDSSIEASSQNCVSPHVWGRGMGALYIVARGDGEKLVGRG
jgi:hypothetical protein